MIEPKRVRLLSGAHLVASDPAVIELRKRLLEAFSDCEEPGLAAEAQGVASIEFRGMDCDVAADADLGKECLRRMERVLE